MSPETEAELRAQIAALQAQAAQQGGEPELRAETPLAVGQVLHGFCGGAFGRDHYDCCRVEALGPDWIVVRDDEGYMGFATGVKRLLDLREYRAENDYCPSHPCPVQPAGRAFMAGEA